MDEVERKKAISNLLDRLLVFLAIIIGAAICYVAGALGILPISILIFGFIISAITGKGTGIRLTYMLVRTLGQIGFIVCAASAIALSILILRGDSVVIESEIFGISGGHFAWMTILAVLAFFFALGTIALKYLWFVPLSRQLDDLHHLVIRERKPTPRVPAIMAREGLRSFSTADELRKWGKLREEGAISDTEFDEVRRKLLNLK